MNTTNFNRMLMTDDCLGHALGLRCGGALLFEDVESYPAAVYIKRHKHLTGVLVDGADVMEKTGEQPCLIAEFPFREMLPGNSKT